MSKKPEGARQFRVIKMNDCSVEKEIQEKGLTAPRVTQADIEANIASEHCFTAADGVRGRDRDEYINDLDLLMGESMNFP